MEPSESTKRIRHRLLFGIAVVLVLAAAALQLFSVRIGGHFYRRSGQIDAREAELSVEEYDEACSALPGSEIRWSVPIGNERFDSFSEELSLSSLPEEDVELLMYFPRLKKIDARHCADSAALAAAAQLLPQAEIAWSVPSADGAVDGNTQTLSVRKTGYDELRSLLSLLPRLQTLDLRESSLNEAEVDEICSSFPMLRVIYIIHVWGEDISSDSRSLTLKDGVRGDLSELTEALLRLEELQSADLRGADLSAKELGELLEICPSQTQYLVPLCGERWDADSEEIDISGNQVDDLAEVENAVAVLPKLKKLIMCGCGISNEEMEALGERHPETDFIWEITFGGGRFTVRTDLVSFSTLRTHFGEEQHRFTDEELEPLFRYCRHLRALDLGHNYLRDISLIGDLPDLIILILGDNPYLEDLTPLGNLKELEYLELFNSHRDYDFSFLYKLTKLQYLNLSYFSELKEIAFIDTMPELKMFWFRGSGVDETTAEEYAEKYPNVLFHFGNCGWQPSATCHGWRKTETNILVRTQFRSWRDVIAIEGLDSIQFDPNATVIYCIPLDE